MFDEIKEVLQNNRDIKYKAFVEKSVPTANHVMGIRLPLLRKIAIKICKGDVKDFLENYPCVSYEDRMLMGVVIAQCKLPMQNKIKYIANYVSSIEDWGTCDTMVATLKLKEDELEGFYDFIINYRDSLKEYELRFLIVTLMYYYLDPKYWTDIIDIIENMKVDYYYTNMAMGWLIASMYFMDKEYILDYLNRSTLGDFTYNKALQKIIESNKITKEEKQQIKLIKRNKK